jgi:hypothetical protein
MNPAAARALRTLPLLLLASCGWFNGKDSAGEDDGGDGASDGGGGGGGGNDGGGEGDADADSDADADADSDVDPDCDDPPAPVDYDEANCITDTLSCGGALTAVTTGGTSNLDGRDYSSVWGCEVVGTESYQGPERMFEFLHPGTGFVTISLESPCEDLDLFAMYWSFADSCVRSGVSIIECEGDISTGGGAVSIWNNEPARYVVVVEGEFGEDAPFTLRADCDPDDT